MTIVDDDELSKRITARTLHETRSGSEERLEEGLAGGLGGLGLLLVLLGLDALLLDYIPYES